jgi:hypothetical protein
MARQYNKKSPYWENRKKISSVAERVIAQELPLNGTPEFFNISFSNEAIAEEKSRRGSRNSSSKVNTSAIGIEWGQFNQIKNSVLPYHYNNKGNYYDIKEAIDIVQRAYGAVGIIKNAIDVQAELANDGIFLDGGTKRARDFFTAWFETIDLDSCKEQYFREYYKSGNVFFYRIDGEIKFDSFDKYPSKLKNIRVKIPLKYTLLNPYDISCNGDLSFSITSYGKVLSSKEIRRLKSPITDKDKNLRNSLPKDVLKRIDSSNGFDAQIFYPLEPSNLILSFYKKQDYEPFAIPMVWPVLRDVNMKIEMKKLDAAAMRMVDQIVLLITMGAEPDKGGVNDRYMKELKELLANGSVGRVLVSDWTTKADFLIPDLNKVLGKEKYEVLNQDIKEGLQNILNLEGTYSGLSTKLKIFMKTLQEGRRRFLTDFLKPQMELIGERLGLKKIPEPKFKEIDFENKEALQRVALRLYELGAITPQQLMEVFDNGIYPLGEEIKDSQEEFIEDRKKGFYNPIVGGVPMIASKSEQERIKISKEQLKLNIKENNLSSNIPTEEENKTPNQAGRPQGSSNASQEKSYSIKKIKPICDYFNKVAESCIEEGREFFRSKDEKVICDKVYSILTTVGMACPMEDWKKKTLECVKNPENLFLLEPLEGIKEILNEHDGLNDWGALILYHSEQ